MLSIIVTAYREEKTIAKVVRHLLDSQFSGLGKHKLDSAWELILVAPDVQTRSAAKQELKKLAIPETNWQILIDQQKGKPVALNMCLAVAKGDWLLLTDGDVTFGKNAVWEIVELAEAGQKSHIAGAQLLGGVSSRPVGKLAKTTMLNYWGKLLADAAHHKRTLDLTEHSEGFSRRIVPKRKFFPLTGYGMLIRNLNWVLPEDILADDAYISYGLHNQGFRLGYAPEARVLVKYPTKLSDYFKQKKRSTGGYLQLWQYGVVRPETKSRSFWRELEYFWFPIRYAQNLREVIWSLLLYPTRAWLWLLIFWERKVQKKSFKKTWVRVESTK